MPRDLVSFPEIEAPVLPQTAQEIFDAVAKHLARQGHRCVNERGSCVYRGPLGDACAVGHLIPDEEYDSTIEDRTVFSIAEDMAFDWMERLKPNRNLLADLQDAHDAPMIEIHGSVSANPTPIVERLRQTADRHGLSFAILDTLTFPALWQ